MFDHVTIRVSDRTASERFYGTVLGAIGVGPPEIGDDFAEWNDFSIAPARADRPVTRNLHIGFFAPSRELVDAFWNAGIEAGYRSDGEPGPRPEYRDDYYGAFLLDPDGNSAEAVCHGDLRRAGNIDHLWIRIADVEASKAFYELVAPHAGFELRHYGGEPHRAQFASADGSFSVVDDGSPAENVHLAFPAADDAVVERFHRALIAVGHRDNGAPGERPEYHPGYYGAYVLDPDGNNVELVSHNRPT
jgi:catechol 2,3-dioxygenase-like lactoylglutathione lyase family enzyme